VQRSFLLFEIVHVPCCGHYTGEVNKKQERLLSFPDSGSLTPDPWLNSLGYRMVISDRRNVSIYKRTGDTIYVYLIADTRTEYARVFISPLSCSAESGR
jgi:hypothetical protein